MSDAHRLSTPRGLALARMLATAPRSARLGHPSALPPPSCSLISPLLSAACARPRPPRTAGRARCHRRSLLRPRSQSPHSHVQQSLHRRAATDLLRSQPACPRAPPPSCSRRPPSPPSAGARVAEPPRATSGSTEQSHGCVWSHRCSRCPSPRLAAAGARLPRMAVVTAACSRGREAMGHLWWRYDRLRVCLDAAVLVGRFLAVVRP